MRTKPKVGIKIRLIRRFRKLCTPTLDLVNMNAYIKFGQNMSVSSQDIEQKHNCGVNQGL